jgi:uncharacterized membrane protein
MHTATLSPIIAIHLTAALSALVLGPVALWARRGRQAHPRLHRAFGYAWVAMMVMVAASALFIRGHGLPNLAGYSPIHLLVPVVFMSLFGAFRALYRGNVAAHRRTMQALYGGACIVAGVFTLLPGRFLGHLVWHQWLGWT